MPERNLTITTANGLHARPAALFVKAAAAQPAKITIAKKGGVPVSAASIIGILSLQIQNGDEVTLASEDAGSDTSLDTLVEYLGTDLDA
ncbi:MAG TPA: HPr family phosphocarrier protein [Lacisediminihabitans sp.]|uniref:HPr family phosphocarrier protein n=1 Tax=Lacisediminihabitans sp. TaxID=2787631 RepID=UPI002EDAC8C5